MTPETIAGFQIQRLLGKGGMAEVFLARKPGAEGTYKVVVLKRILPEHGRTRRFRSMFIDEASLATRLNHPNIVQVYELSDSGDDGLLLSMEYVEGLDLGRLIASIKQLGDAVPPMFAAHLIGEAAKGLHYAHERRDEGGAALDIVHRDVSPQNILLSLEGVVKIADFGIATAKQLRDESGVMKGKFRYMSPEQARGGTLDRRSDIYSLGLVFYELLTLESPFGNLRDSALVEAVRAGLPEPSPMRLRPDIPKAIDDIVTRMLSHEPTQRFATARDVSLAIGQALLQAQELIEGSRIGSWLGGICARDRSLLEGPHPDAGEGTAQQTVAEAPIARAALEPAASAPPAPRETRHVAVVALRLEGFRELEAALGHALAERALQTLRGTLSEIGYKHQAHWTWTGGGTARAIIGLGTNASRAASEAALLAVDIHEALEGASQDHGVSLRAAIVLLRGVASGRRDTHGHLLDHELDASAATLADEVRDQTPIRTTWVAGGLFRIVRREFRWEEAPNLELDGPGPEKVTLRLQSLIRPLTLIERTRELASQSDLVGRDAEKADLHAAYHRAVFGTFSPASAHVSLLPPPASLSETSRGQLVTRVVMGDMGIGKTALVQAFATELPSEARSIRVECSPIGTEMPYGTLRDVLAALVPRSEDPTVGLDVALRRHIDREFPPGSLAPEDARLLEQVVRFAGVGRAGAPLEESEAALRFQLARGIRLLLGAMAQREPLVVVVDGIQWADESSLSLIKDLVTGGARGPVLVILSARPAPRLDGHLEGIVRIGLPGLNPEEQVRLVETRLGTRRGVRGIAEDLLPRAAGNPFFLLELIETLLEKHILELVDAPNGELELVRNDPEGASLDLIPSSLEQLIGDRLRELPIQEREIVEWLAVAGGPLSVVDVVALSRAENETIARLCAGGVCDRRDDTIDLRNPIVRDVAYQALDGATQERMHRRLGEHLSSTPLAQGVSAAIVARHFVLGGAPNSAASLYMEAASSARHNNQDPLAERYYEQALALLPVGSPDAFDAHAALETLFRSGGRREQRAHHLSALRSLARASRNATKVARAHLSGALYFLDDGQLARALPLAEQAFATAEAAGLYHFQLEALLIQSEVLSALGERPGALAACDRALAISRTHHLPSKAHAEALRVKGILLRRAGHPDQALNCYAEAIALFQLAGARRSEARARNAMAYSLYVLERFEDSIHMGKLAVSLELNTGGRLQLARTLANVGAAYTKLGALDRAAQYVERALLLHERYGDRDALAETLLRLSQIELLRGQLSIAERHLNAAKRSIAHTQNRNDAVLSLLIEAQWHLECGDSESAFVSASDGRARASAQGLVSDQLYAMALELQALDAQGRREAALPLAHELLLGLEATEATEHSIEVRATVTELFARASSRDMPAVATTAALHLKRVASGIVQPELRKLFFSRPVVQRTLSFTEGLLTASEGPR